MHKLPLLIGVTLAGLLCAAVSAQEPASRVKEVVEVDSSRPKATALSNQGKALYKKLQCANCHSIGTVGGCLAPPLDGVGNRRTAEYLTIRLSSAKGDEDKFIKLIGHPELLPHPRFPRKSVDALVAYMMTLPSSPEPYVVANHQLPRDLHEDKRDPNFKPLPASASSRAGRKLYQESGCAMCHSIGKVGGWFGPRLDGVGARHSRSYIEALIANPPRGSGNERPKMPRINLSALEVRQLTDFLLTLPQP